MVKPTHPQAPRVERLARTHAPIYREMMQAAYAQAPEAWISTARERDGLPLQWWENRIEGSDQTSVAFGAFVEGALVGMAGIRFGGLCKTRHKATLFGMYVAPQHRASGLGKQRVHATLEHARSRGGITVVQLNLIEGNDSAMALYEACGFKTYAMEPRALHADGRDRSIINMWLELPDGPRHAIRDSQAALSS